MNKNSEDYFVIEFLQNAKANFSSIKNYAERAFEQLSEEELHLNNNGENNSVAIILQHISGNLKSRFTDFLISDGEKPDRKRDDEFVDQLHLKKTLIENWESSWDILFKTLEKISTEEFFNRKVYIRNEPHSVMQALTRQIWHYSFHAGQIVLLAKQLKGSSWKNLSIPKKK